jgi:NAD-dependent deacetylase
MTLDAGGAIAIITQGPTPYDGRAAARCGGDVEEEMAAIAGALGVPAA